MILALLLVGASAAAHAQATPVAAGGLRLAAFGGVTGTYTGIEGGKNLDVTAGLDFGIRPFFGLQPSVEVRGTYPVDKGAVDNQRNVLAGLRIEKSFGRLHPYADFLFGRGGINYAAPGYPGADGQYLYLETNSNVFSPGAGVDVDLSEHFAVKADAQFEHYDTPVTASGSLYAKALTAGVVYRFNFNHHDRPR